ncbi:MAG TPA: hypothetical protein VH458_06825 [Vicinamibacterales bacterium]|jgi:hypothetical protein
MRAGCLLLAVVAFSVQPVLAQTTTADGVQALIRGDYQTAARILRQLAEDTPTPDPTAQFFLATLYESGNAGGPPNIMRACNLYVAAARPENPLSSQSERLAQPIVEKLRGPLSQFCSGNSWNEFPPTTFTLSPDHWVRFDQAGTTVSYKGTQRVTRGQNGGPGFVFPPMRYVPLDVSRPTPKRRHLFEFFVWMPNGSTGQTVWTLGWVLSEVNDADLVGVAGDPALLTVTSSQPPDLDLSTVVRVGVNADGEAEWAIVTGPKQRGGVIPPRVVQ